MTTEEIVRIVTDRLLQQGLRGAKRIDVLTGYCVLLKDLGVPLLRMHVAQRTLHPEVGGFGFVWWREGSVKEESYPLAMPNQQWLVSPLFHMLVKRQFSYRERLLEGPSRFTFLNELRLILPVVGVDFLRKPNTDRKQSDDLGASPDPEFYVNHLRKGIAARAIETDGEFVLLKGSRGSLNEAQSFSEKLKSFRDAILESGRAVKHDNGTFETTEDISFSSPSAAAVFLFGTSRNGRSDWLLQGQGQTYGDWKDSKLDEQPTS